MSILAGDVGGTKTRLGLYDSTDATTPLVERVYPSAAYPHLEDLVAQFLQETGRPVTQAVFGMPGAVIRGTVKVTNLPWTVSEAELRAALNLPQVKLLNDLEATAYAIPFLPASDLLSINEVTADPTGNKAIIAPGTGLGESVLFYAEGRYHASATEGGHADFAPRTLFELRLLKYLLGRFGHVSYERLCSGQAFPTIYKYVRKHSKTPEVPDIAAALKEAEDPAPLIVEAALNKRSALCEETLTVFVSILAAEAGNMALKVLAKGGVYLGGGIPPKILPALTDGRFMAVFLDKGRFSDLLASIPVYVILNDKAALFGAACYALGWHQRQ
jgi:glucokinase